MAGLRRRPVSTPPRQPRREVTSRRDFFSYHASRQQQNNTGVTESRRVVQGEQKTGRPSFVVRRPFTVASIVLLVLCASYNMSLSTQPQIAISAGPAKKALRSNAAYQKGAQQIVESSVLNRMKLTFATNDIEGKLQQAFPELSDISVSLPLMGRSPLIRATAEQPALLLTSDRGVFLVGVSGKVLAKTADVTGSEGLTIPTIQDQAGLQLSPGKGALSKQDVTFITTLIKQFDHQNITITSLTLPALASELHVRIAGVPYYIKFSLLTDPRVATGQYFALKDKLAKDGVTPAEYVDSRIEERVYYK